MSSPGPDSQTPEQILQKKYECVCNIIASHSLSLLICFNNVVYLKKKIVEDPENVFWREELEETEGCLHVYEEKIRQMREEKGELEVQMGKCTDIEM